MPTKKDDIPEPDEVTEDATGIPEDEGIEAPTSNDVGEQTLTKADTEPAEDTDET